MWDTNESTKWDIYHLMHTFEKKEKSQISNLARDDHTEWSQRKTNIIWYHLYVEYNKNDTKECIYERETNIDFEIKLTVMKEEFVGWGGIS